MTGLLVIIIVLLIALIVWAMRTRNLSTHFSTATHG